MAKYRMKTTENTNDVSAFIGKIPDEQRRTDAFKIIDIMRELSGFEPTMWGPSIIGFGSYHYKYESGHESRVPLAGFSPRKAEFALYLDADFKDKDELLSKLGKHKTGKACIYIKKLSNINVDVLKQMILSSIATINLRYMRTG